MRRTLMMLLAMVLISSSCLFGAVGAVAVAASLAPVNIPGNIKENIDPLNLGGDVDETFQFSCENRDYTWTIQFPSNLAANEGGIQDLLNDFYRGTLTLKKVPANILPYAMQIAFALLAQGNKDHFNMSQDKVLALSFAHSISQTMAQN